MTEKIIKFIHRVKEAVPELSVDALIEMWEKIDQDSDSNQDSPTPTCKHEFRKCKKANTQCKTKVKGGNDYCSKHKK